MPLNKRDFTIKRNDTLPALEINIFDRGVLGEVQPFNLSGATGVTFTMMDKNGNYRVERSDGIIMSITGGTIQYPWKDGDTTDGGDYFGEFQINYSNGGRLSIPQEGYINITIFKDINLP